MNADAGVQSSAVRLADVATAAGVSVAAASMALSDSPRISPDTKRRVRQVCERLGYRRPTGNRRRPRRSRKRGAYKFGFVGLGTALHDETHIAVLQTLGDTAARGQVRFEFISIEDVSSEHDTARRVLEFAQPLDGLLLTDFVSVNLLARLTQQRVAYVVMGGVPPLLPEGATIHPHNVMFDVRSGMRYATAHLLRAGHRRIAFIAEVPNVGLMQDLALDGYRLAHHDAGAALEGQLVVMNPQGWRDYPEPAKQLVSGRQRPTAFVVPDARVADFFLQAMHACHAAVSPGCCVVIAGTPELASRHRLDAHPLMMTNIKRFTRLAVRHLRQLCERPDDGPMEILLPCDPAGFDRIMGPQE